MRSLGALGAGMRRRRGSQVVLLLAVAVRCQDSGGGGIFQSDVPPVGNTACAAACQHRATHASERTPLSSPHAPLTPLAARRETVPQCMSYERSVCTDEGRNVQTPDSAPNGLVAYYTFDDSQGVDSSGRGNHAKVAAPAGPGHGPSGFGAAFDGSRMMEVPRTPDFESNDLTVSFWMYLLHRLQTCSKDTNVKHAMSGRKTGFDCLHLHPLA